MVAAVGSNDFSPTWSLYSQVSKPQANLSSRSGQEEAAQKGDLIAKLSEKELKRLGLKQCKTCQSRVYMDVSEDPGVSFKTPTQLSPQAADSAVRAHEGEHVQREASKATRQDRRVISQNVQIFTDICPECGRAYTSGGKTTTVTAPNPKSDSKLDNKGLLLSLFA